MITQENFFISSAGAFVPTTEYPERKPDYVSYSKRYKTTSSYFYTDEGLYRVSDHWGKVARCKWELRGVVEETDKCVMDEVRVGFISWKDLEMLN
mgnify:CR=1 FL=1|tara:strand:- start:766 stop:1050 length:285 start_codon:yes stop_codon:yes gene_type:complete